jgi:hypothetical protein
MNGGYGFLAMRDHDTPILERGTCNDARPINREPECPLCRYGWLVDDQCELCRYFVKNIDDGQYVVWSYKWSFLLLVSFDDEGKIVRKNKLQYKYDSLAMQGFNELER